MTTRQKISSALSMGALILACLPGSVRAATGTLSPAPRIYVTTSSGAPINGACIWTYLAGTSTATTTWSDKALTAANSNPVVTASSGLALIYLQPGISYKYIVETACTPPAHGSVLYSQDNIDAVPASASAVDVLGTAGESIALGNAVYLSAGDAGKSAGQWYKADSANAYSSTANQVGIATGAIGSGLTGSIRMGGSVPGLSALTPGSTYYVGTAGALTATVPVNGRVLGQADTTTSLVFGSPQSPGKQTLWVPANAMSVTITNGASGPTVAELTAGNPNLTSISFLNGVNRNAQFSVAFPKSWNAGTVTYQAYWTGTIAGAGTTIWGMQCVAAADNQTIDAAFGTAIEVTDTFLTVKFNHVAPESAALTVSSAAADTLVTCQVYRKGASDTRAQASLLLGVKFLYTINRLNDQ